MRIFNNERIRQLFQTKLIRNYFYLSAYQMVNFLLPLVIIPFIVKNIGISNYGRITFSYAFVTYFSVLTDYGFNLSATRDIAIHRASHKRVVIIFNAVLQAKLLLLSAAAGIFFSLVLFVPFFQDQWLLHTLSFSIVVQQTLFPIWFFQGMEDMKYIAIVNTVSRLLFFGLILTVIVRPEQYVYVNFLQGMGGLAATSIAYIIVLRRYRLKLRRIPLRRIRMELVQGFPLFLSTFAVSVYVNSNSFVLGFFADSRIVGLYGVAEKVILAIKQLMTVFSQVTFPYICVLARESHQKVSAFLQRSFIPFSVAICSCCILAYVFAGPITNYLTKEWDDSLITMLRVFSVLPIIILLDMPAYQTLLAYNCKRAYSRVLITAVAVNLLSNIILAQYFQAYGTIVAVILTELFITIGLNYVLHLKYPQYSIRGIFRFKTRKGYG